MEKNEHSIFLDIPMGKKNGRFHSAVLTTYAIDLIHFDRHLLNTLHRKQICSVNILADYGQMAKSMEYVSPSFMERVGKEYSISNMLCPGAFHPKINFFVGDDSALVLLGTGNLTVAGHGKNHEVFSGFMIDETDDKQRPLIEECWRYLTHFTSQCSVFDRNRILHEIPDNCSFLDERYEVKPHRFCDVQDNLKAALLYNDETSGIFKQLSELIPFEEVKKITVISPFFDEKGETLLSFAKFCPEAKLDVLIQKECSLPPCNMPSHTRISFYDFNQTTRGQMNFSVYDRKLHAKIFHFKTDSTEYCLIGSANATVAGMGTMENRGINEEFSVLYSSTDKRFLTELGLTARKKLDVKVASMKRQASEEDVQHLKKVRLLSAEYENGKLTVTYQGNLPADSVLVVNNGSDTLAMKPRQETEGILLTDTIIGKIISTCYVINGGGDVISNKIFINNIEQLETTNPSQTSRSLNRFVSLIENEGYNGMDVANILCDIMWDMVSESDESISQKVSVFPVSMSAKKGALPIIKYNAEYDNGAPHNSRLLFIDRTSRLIDCIEDSIRKKIRSIDDAINDEEEEGTTETSNKRDVQEFQEITVPKRNHKMYSAMATSVLNKYMDMVEKRKEQCSATGIRYITKDDLNFFSLCIFAAMEICSLNRSKYSFDTLDKIDKSLWQKKLYESLDRCVNIDGLNALEKFSTFCKTMKILTPREEDFDKKAKRTMKYVILYATLFYKNATEKELKFLWPRVLTSIKQLITLFGMPTMDYLINELMPISERYGYVFRESNIERLIKKL